MSAPLIQAAAHDVLSNMGRAGDIGHRARRGWCMRFVREVVETAMLWRDGELYQRLGTHRTQQPGSSPRTDWSWWAADIERSMREGGHSVAVPHAGCLVFCHALGKPYGHVGVMVSRELVLEAVNPAHRPTSLTRGDLALTPIKDWPQRPTLYALIPPPGNEETYGPAR